MVSSHHSHLTICRLISKIYTTNSSQARTNPSQATRSLHLLNSTVISHLVAIFTTIDNLTKEQFSGVTKRPGGVLSASRDTLNPLLNTQTLKNRLAVIEHFKTQAGQHAYWPHYAMTNVARHLLKYKFNYAVKGFAAYVVYRDIANYNHLNQRTFLTI